MSSNEPLSIPGRAPASPGDASPKGRNLVVCCDGTNNTITGGIEDTNVLLLYSYLLKHTSREDTTLYYDPGVGTPDAAPPTDLTDLVKRRWARVAGLASGRGVYDNIAEAYRFLMLHWQGPQDRIFCFGFSRGAFTARCVVGMVNLFGVIRPEHESLLPTLVRIYFSQPPEDEQVHGRKNWRRRWTRWLHRFLARPERAGSEASGASEESTQATRNDLAAQVRRSFGIDDPGRRAGVHWVGVWDTVESVGLPVLFARDNPATASFHDKPGIRNVRHALALDEHRRPFLPRLYDEPSEVVIGDRTLKQVWFPGVHCDVGGSYLKGQAGLSDASLVWMFNEVAPEFGLAPLTALPRPGEGRFDDLGMPRAEAFPGNNPLRHDALWDTPAWALGGMVVRDMGTHRIATVGEVRRAMAAGGHDAARKVGVRVDVRAVSAAQADGPSVWDRRRKLWPAWLAVGVAVLGLFLSGRVLVESTPEPLREIVPVASSDGGFDIDREAWARAPAAACQFALQQLASLPRWDPQATATPCGPVAAKGLRDPVVWRATLERFPVWSMAWDLLTTAGLGYLLARLGSRGFTFLAGFRRPGQALPWWRHAGLLPMVAVVADVGENLLTVLAVVMQTGTPVLVPSVLVAAAGLSVLKFLGWFGCLAVFVPLRLALAVLPLSGVGKVGRRVDRG